MPADPKTRSSSRNTGGLAERSSFRDNVRATSSAEGSPEPGSHTAVSRSVAVGCARLAVDGGGSAVRDGEAERGEALAVAFEGKRAGDPGAHAERETRAAALTRARWGERARATRFTDAAYHGRTGERGLSPPRDLAPARGFI